MNSSSVKLIDVARAAAVDIATVSRALNRSRGWERLSSEWCPPTFILILFVRNSLGRAVSASWRNTFETTSSYPFIRAYP